MPMEGKIVTLQDSKNGNIFPQTTAKAVYMSDGKTVEEAIKSGGGEGTGSCSISYEETSESIVMNNPDMISKISELDKVLTEVNSQLEQIVISVKNYGAKGDGVTDDTLAIQNAIGTDFTKYGYNPPSNVMRKVIFERGKTYCISSTIKIPPYTDVDFNGCTIKAIDGGIFINNYMLSVNSENCVTWSFPYYYRVGEIKNVILNGNDKVNIRGIFICSYHRLIKIKGWKLYNTIYCPNLYIDNFYLEDIKINYPMGSDYQIYKSGQGDGIHISKIHTPSDIEELRYGNGLNSGGANILCLKQCGGGVIENIINGKIEIRTSYALTLSNLHLETGSLEIYDSNCIVKDSIIFKRNEVSNVPIYLDDVNYSSITMGSKPIIFDNVQILHYYKLSEYPNEKIDIDISNFRGVLSLRNTYRRIANNALIKTSNCGIILNNGSKTIYNIYDNTTIKNKKLIMNNSECISSMANFITSIDEDSNINWNKSVGDYYYNACQIIDIDRKVGKNTTNTTIFRASAKGACINIGYTETNSIIRLYRGNSATNFTEYVDIPNPLGVIFDNGISANGYVWKQLSSPITGAEIQNIISGLINNGGYVIARGISIPTTGKWWQGDTIINNNPTEQGTSGSKYVVNGWTCIASGTPGTWIQNRNLTGN